MIFTLRDVKCTFFCFDPHPIWPHPSDPAVTLSFLKSITVVLFEPFLMYWVCLEIQKKSNINSKEGAEIPDASWWFMLLSGDQVIFKNTAHLLLCQGKKCSNRNQMWKPLHPITHQPIPDSVLYAYHYVKPCFSNIWPRWERSRSVMIIANFNFILACFLRDYSRKCGVVQFFFFLFFFKVSRD